MIWKHIAGFLVGFIAGSAFMIVINPETGEPDVVVCTQTQGGGAQWSDNCPDEIKNKYPDGCPQFQ